MMHAILRNAVFLFVFLAMGGVAFAQGQGGFIGPGPNVVTVEEAKAMKHDSKVVLQGYIMKQHSGDKYLFQDGSGSIVVEIDHKKWAGQTVTPADKIEIHGEVDVERSQIKIDVDSLKKL